MSHSHATRSSGEHKRSREQHEEEEATSKATSAAAAAAPAASEQSAGEEPEAKHEAKKAKHEATTTGYAAPIERGHAYFLFRPKVEMEEAHSLKEVQKLYLWLSPERVQMADHVTHPLGVAPDASAAEKRRVPKRALAAASKGVHAKHRLLVIPTKRLPSTNVRQPHWAFVEEVCDSVEDVKKHLGEIHYHTKTRGDRTTHAARIVGEAVYEIAQAGKQTYLLYDLELPHTPAVPQHAFNIQEEGIFLIQVKNPNASSANREGVVVAGLKKSERPSYPRELQEAFKGIRVKETKFAALQPEMLNYKGTELLLLGTKGTPAEVLGSEEVEFLETMAELEVPHGGDDKEKEALAKATGVESEPVTKW